MFFGGRRAGGTPAGPGRPQRNLDAGALRRRRVGELYKIHRSMTDEHMNRSMTD